MTAPAGPRAALLAAATAAGGAVTGVAAVAVHDRSWGLPLLTLASLAGLLALPARWGTRLPGALAWSLVVLLAVRGRPEGDAPVGVGADGVGWLLVLLAGLLPVLAVLTTRRARGPAAPPARRATGRGADADPGGAAA